MITLKNMRRHPHRMVHEPHCNPVNSGVKCRSSKEVLLTNVQCRPPSNFNTDSLLRLEDLPHWIFWLDLQPRYETTDNPVLVKSIQIDPENGQIWDGLHTANHYWNTRDEILITLMSLYKVIMSSPTPHAAMQCMVYIRATKSLQPASRQHACVYIGLQSVLVDLLCRCKIWITSRPLQREAPPTTSPKAATFIKQISDFSAKEDTWLTMDHHSIQLSSPPTHNIMWSSPHYPQSNGMVDRQTCTARLDIKKIRRGRRLRKLFTTIACSWRIFQHITCTSRCSHNNPVVIGSLQP